MVRIMFKTLLVLSLAIWQVSCLDPTNLTVQDLFDCPDCHGNESLISQLFPGGFSPTKIPGQLFNGTQLAIIKVFLQSDSFISSIASRISSIVISSRSTFGKGVDNLISVIDNVPIVGSRIGDALCKGKNCVSTNDTAIDIAIGDIVVCARNPLIEVIVNVACVATDIGDLQGLASKAWKNSTSKFPPIKAINSGQHLLTSKDTRSVGAKTLTESVRLILSIIIAVPKTIACGGSDVVKNVIIRIVVNVMQTVRCIMQPQ